jgi:hypothetical protein
MLGLNELEGTGCALQFRDRILGKKKGQPTT